MTRHRFPNKFALLVLGIIVSTSVGAQSGHYWSATVLNQEIEKYLTADKSIDFMSVKPYAIKEIDHWLTSQTDTALVLNQIAESFWSIPEPKELKINLIPIFDFGLGYSNSSKGIYTTAAGVAGNIRYGPKWSLYTDALVGEVKQPQYLKIFSDSTQVIVSRGKNHANAGNPSFVVPTARLSFAPSQYFNFELGYGTNFFGQGYRSLCLSDFAYNYPYFKITTDVWRFKYVNLFSALRGTDGQSFDPNNFKSKYTSTHYLNWAISPKLNVGIFETIVWQGRDSLSIRGFDPNYLNPIIFYRPVEYSVGSPDNALIGLDLSYKMNPTTVLFGQFVIDEFLLSEFRDRTGWWANKWAAQLGFKLFDFAKIENLYLQGEVNIVRPFTYTHGSVLQNFGHFNQPLAHPLGANFYEALLRIYYQTKNWYAESIAVFSRYGVDPENQNMGSDIFKSYVNPSLTHGNKIAQGMRGDLYFQTIKMGYILNSKMNLRASVIYQYRYNHIEKEPLTNEHIFGIELSTMIFKRNHSF